MAQKGDVMESKKATTMSQRFGFMDSELKTPRHDELMVWLDANIKAILRPRVIEPKPYYSDGVATWGERLFQVVWEKPVMSNQYMVGFADMYVMAGHRAEKPVVCAYGNSDRAQFQIGDLVWARDRSGRAALYWFEVKPSIPSAGEAIRQIRMYQQYTNGHWFIVSPDERCRESIERQGIGFINPNEHDSTEILI
ncbi:MAG: hypothetical protein ACOYD4_11675 [Solirubrobacterales bacterium]